MAIFAPPSPPAGEAGAHPGAALAAPETSLADEPVVRPARPEDAGSCGRICFAAFATISAHHAFPRDFPSEEEATGLFDFMLARSDVHVVVAEINGRIVGSNALWEQTPIAGVGPITVDPALQNAAVGRTLMRHVLGRAERLGYRGVRLCQAAYHGRSLALYTKLGFQVRQPLAVFQGPAIGAELPGRAVRPASEGDLDACALLHERLHGYSRVGELAMVLDRGTARVVEHEGRVTGYATDIGFFGHAVGEVNEDVMALIGAAEAFGGPGILVPSTNVTLMRWCLEHGLRIVQPMTLMSQGFYAEPQGAYLPSVLY